jgi:hypothetical protein
MRRMMVNGRTSADGQQATGCDVDDDIHFTWRPDYTAGENRNGMSQTPPPEELFHYEPIIHQDQTEK